MTVSHVLGGDQSVSQAMARVRRPSLAGDRERPAAGVAGERMPAAHSSHSSMSASGSSMSASGFSRSSASLPLSRASPSSRGASSISGPRAATSESQALQGPDAGVGKGTGTGAGADTGAGIIGAGTGAALGVAGTNMGVAKPSKWRWTWINGVGPGVARWKNKLMWTIGVGATVAIAWAIAGVGTAAWGH